jgi:hypothetical protein
MAAQPAAAVALLRTELTHRLVNGFVVSVFKLLTHCTQSSALQVILLYLMVDFGSSPICSDVALFPVVSLFVSGSVLVAVLTSRLS